MQPTGKKVLGFTAAITLAAVVFLFQTDPSPESQTTAGTNSADHDGTAPESGLVNSSPLTVPSTFSPMEPAKTPSLHAVPVHQLPSGQTADEKPYSPTAEELRRFYDLKSKVFLQDMTMRRFLALDEFAALPEPMQLQMVREVVRMVNEGKLDGRQFIQELPPSGSHDPQIVNEKASKPLPAPTQMQSEQRLQRLLDMSPGSHE
jgi:hypothetical protein